MILEGFMAIMNPSCLGLIIGGTVIGIIFGALPGLTSTMAIALCLPYFEYNPGLKPSDGTLYRRYFWRTDFSNSDQNSRDSFIYSYNV
jgi:TctA family transporter